MDLEDRAGVIRQTTNNARVKRHPFLKARITQGGGQIKEWCQTLGLKSQASHGLHQCIGGAR